jgi:hypothetical protein
MAVVGSTARYYQWLAKIVPGFDYYLTSLDQVTAIRELAFAQDCLSCFKMSRHRAVRKQRELRPIHTDQKRMERHARGQRFAFYRSPYLCLCNCFHDLLVAV